MMRARLEDLLASEVEAEGFFAAGAPDVRLRLTEENPLTPPEPAAVDEQVGTRVGPYKLLQRIGEGGCGVVYMAEQERPVRRRVAFKIIKLGMDTKNVIARFEAERQALAMMDHPNIARVLDAGATETGRPYFVMELVRGVKITDYCDQNHLDTPTRLHLFIQVCHAIQHAHQKGIIHRDIKPSNILVTLHDGVPVPKVIDFGIAKAIEQRLTELTLFTAYEQLIGTPAYMSPEQAEMSGLDVDTRSDIYSLGVLLYELLTGRTPFDSKELVRSGVDEMRRTLREREPERPSLRLHTLQRDELTATAVHRHAEPPKLISQMRGDLDWIVMKALEKDRTRRYETANGLAMDIQRHLNNEPVMARPPSRLYRFQKLVRRNRAVFAATSAVAVALLAGLGTSTLLFLREREARQRAVEAERQQALLRVEAERGREMEAELRQQAELRAKIVQASAALGQDQFSVADRIVEESALTQPTMEGAQVFRSLGDWHAVRGQWREAASRFNIVLQVDALDGLDIASLDLLRAGPAFIELGGTAEYESFRRAAVEKFSDTANAMVAERVMKISLLRPCDGELMKQLAGRAAVIERSLAGLDESLLVGEEASLSVWRMISMALWEYRRGQPETAVRWCQRCLAYPIQIGPRSANAHVILSMALRDLGHSDAADRELAKGAELVRNKFRTGLDQGSGQLGFWFDWVFAKILLEEAEAAAKR